MNKNKIRVLILTIDEPYFIPKTCYPLFYSKYCSIVGIGIMAPVLGKQSIFKFGLELLNSFGIKGTIQHIAFYVKCFLINFINFFKKNKISFNLKRIAKNRKINTFQIKDVNSKEIISRIKNLNPDIILSIAATQIFKENLIKTAQIATINVHAALLPAYRGASPSFWNLLNNEKKTGITVHYIDNKIDTGNIILQKEIIIEEKETLFSLNSKVAKYTPILLNKVFKLFQEKSISPKKMDILKSSYYSLPKHTDVKKFFNKGKKFY